MLVLIRFLYYFKIVSYCHNRFERNFVCWLITLIFMQFSTEALDAFGSATGQTECFRNYFYDLFYLK